MSDFGPINPQPLQGDEPFLAWRSVDHVTVQDFWRWSCSDLLSNTARGVLAEFIVAQAVGAQGDIRREWDPWVGAGHP